VQPAAKRVETDTLTVAFIGIVVYILGNIVHEGLGHGGACLVTGGRPLIVTAVNMECSVDNRLVTAGGSLMNVVAAGLYCLLGRATSRTSPHLKYFAWLSMTVNMLSAAGYLAFSGIGGFGDWAMFIQGFSPQWAWRVGLTVAGIGGYMAAVRWSLLELRPLIGSDRAQRRILAKRLSIPSYFAGGIVECLAGALNPQGWFLVAMSAAASTFGGTSALLWSAEWLRGSMGPAGPDAEPMPIPRSWAWIAGSAVLAVCFIFVLGRGIQFAGSVPK
jgi:hypothetical protein